MCEKEGVVPEGDVAEVEPQVSDRERVLIVPVVKEQKRLVRPNSCAEDRGTSEIFSICHGKRETDRLLLNLYAVTSGDVVQLFATKHLSAQFRFLGNWEKS